MDVTDGDSVAAEIHDEMAITEDADDIAFLTLEGTGEDSEFDVILANFRNGSRRNVTRSGSVSITLMNGFMILCLMDAGTFVEQLLTRW